MVRIASQSRPQTGSRRVILFATHTVLLLVLLLGFSSSVVAQEDDAIAMAEEMVEETAESVDTAVEDAGADDIDDMVDDADMVDNADMVGDTAQDTAQDAVEEMAGGTAAELSDESAGGMQDSAGDTASDVMVDTVEVAAATESADEAREEVAKVAATAVAPEKNTEVDPSAFAGPPADQEPADLEVAKLIRKGRSMDPKNRVNTRINRYINAAIDKQEEEGPEASLKLLARLNPKRLNRLERASVARIAASLHYSTGDIEAAVNSFQESINEETLPVDQETDMRFNIAQLRAGKYQWEQAIEALYEWFRWSEEEKPVAYYLLGIANFQLKRFDMAIVNTEKALEVADKPKEPWFQLLAALYVQKQNYQKAAPVLEQLVLLYPKKQYWVQLGLIYGAMDNYRASLAVQQVAYAQGFLTSDKDLRRLARSYLYANLPYPAARVLDKGIADGHIEQDSKGLELLANSWIASREYEKSLPPLVEAAEVSENGDLYVRLGQVYLQREDWTAAAEGLEKAIEKGDLTNPGNVKLLLGIAYYNNGETFRSKSWFIEAMEHEKTRDDGKKWIDHIEREADSS